MNPLRILLAEDTPEDAELILLHLSRHGLDVVHRRVETRAEFHRALREGPWDVVLSDFSLPGTDGLELLHDLRSRDPDLPFLLLSGVLDERSAVEAMRSGANDFLLKGNLSRLVPALERELREAEVRRQRRAFEKELQLLHRAIAQTPDLVMITDPRGAIAYVNPAVESVSGYAREELVGQNPRLFKSGLHDASFYRNLWESLLRGETWRSSITNRRKDGTFWNAEVVITPVLDDQGALAHFLWTARDITHERELLALLQQSQRLETVGVLASGIAHDFNNILMPMLGHAQLGLERPPGDPRLHEDLEVILASARRAADLVRRILSFSRRGEGKPVPVDLQALLSEALKLLRAAVPSPISFHPDLAAPGRCVKGEPIQLHQVILNLCTNAAQAMKGTSGKLAVGLAPIHLQSLSCAMGVELAEGDYLCLEVADSGRGIPPEHLDRIFQPFFTTKENGGGTGLGLSVTHGIVSAMGGGIQVESRPGEGTRFLVYFPQATATEAVAVPPLSERGIGRGTILVVDDEVLLGRLLQTVLQKEGYEAVVYRDPEKAVLAFMGSSGAFDLLVTDFQMPGLTGVDLVRSLRALRPDLPAILLTGSLSAVDPDGPVGSLFQACLAKPIPTIELVHTIQDVLRRVRPEV